MIMIIVLVIDWKNFISIVCCFGLIWVSVKLRNSVNIISGSIVFCVVVVIVLVGMIEVIVFIYLVGVVCVDSGMVVWFSVLFNVGLCGNRWNSYGVSNVVRKVLLVSSIRNIVIVCCVMWLDVVVLLVVFMFIIISDSINGIMVICNVVSYSLLVGCIMVVIWVVSVGLNVVSFSLIMVLSVRFSSICMVGFIGWFLVVVVVSCCVWWCRFVLVIV